MANRPLAQPDFGSQFILDVQTTSPHFLELVDAVLGHAVPPAQRPKLQRAEVALADGSTPFVFDGSPRWLLGRRSPAPDPRRLLESRRRDIETKGVNRAMVLLACPAPTAVAQMSIAQDVTKREMVLDFAVSGIRFPRDLRRECLARARQLGLRMSLRRDARPVQALALSVDLRGFTDFCCERDVESHYVLRFVDVFQGIVQSSLYDTLPSMAKATGDGFLYAWVEEDCDLAQTARVIIERVVGVQEELRTVGGKEPFTIRVPTSIGAGLSARLRISNWRRLHRPPDQPCV